MMEIVAYASMAYLAVQSFVVLLNLATFPVLKKSSQRIRARVSILIPARNEENNIDSLLKDLIKTDDNVIEILTYDDDSSDRTSEVIHSTAENDRRIKYIKGHGPMPGWLGKNYACHELAKEAEGDYLLFLDADVRVDENLVDDALDYFSKYQLDLLSVFPVQEMKTTGEWLTVPLMNKILVGNLPLFLIRTIRWKDFSAANGQFMLFRSESYRKIWPHEVLKKERVEDIKILRMMKKLGFRTQTLLSGGQVRCRMYRGYNDALNGFSKNVKAFFGSNWLILILYFLLTSIGPFAVWLVFSWKAMLIYSALLISTRIIISKLSYQNWMLNVILMPLQQATLILLSVKAAWQEITGKLEWKGRKI